MTAEEKKAYKKEWYKKNRERLLKKNKDYRIENPHIMKNYREENKEKIAKLIYARAQTPEGRKSRRISLWKFTGVICEDFDALYEHYINTSFCDNCEVALTEDKVTTATTRCLDHSHETGLFRNVLCNACNLLRRG